jgi:hypothetical protein
MEIITNLWKDRFLELISNSKKSIKITSPFVKENICDNILRVKQENSISNSEILRYNSYL